MAISLGTFFGNGYDAGTMTTTKQLPQGVGRIIAVTADASTNWLQLPFKFSPGIRRKGWPHFLIFNRSLTETVRLADFATTTTIYTIPGDRLIFVGLDHNNDWTFSDHKTFTLGAPL